MISAVFVLEVVAALYFTAPVVFFYKYYKTKYKYNLFFGAIAFSFALAIVAVISSSIATPNGLSMVFVLGLTAALFFTAQLVTIYLYSKTRYKPHFYVSISVFLFALACVCAMLIGAANSVNNLSLIELFGRCCVISGALAYLFLNMFVIATTKPNGKMRGVWMLFTFCFILMFITLTCDLFVEGDIGGIPMFTLTSMYKAPYGMPLVEAAIVAMAVMAAYPTYLFFRVAKESKDRVIRAQSLLLGIGTVIATTGFALEITGAIPYQYMPICVPMIMLGASIIVFGYVMPRQIGWLLIGHAPASADSVESFVERFFVYSVTPTVRTQPNAFSKSLGLNHQQMAGRKVLFEFDPASKYEKAIKDLANEALANAEPAVVFTRMGSAIHSALREQKAIKFFCLTQQVSVPKKFSENEMLLPLNNASLMLDVFDKTLKAHPEANINVVFDSLSDLLFAIGFEKTYRFMKYAIEMLEPSRTTFLFLLNQTAHDPKVTSSLRSLFSDQIFFGKEGIQPVKLSKAEIAQVETNERTAKR